MLILTEETEAMIRAKADRMGRTPDEVVRESLAHAGDVLAWRRSSGPPPNNPTRDELIAAMEKIASRSAARPLADPRSINEIIGYDDFGLPR